MSLIPANIEVIAIGIQTDKATPATLPVIALALEDCALDPGVQQINQAESDQSAQQGDVVVVGAQPGGTFKKYVRPSEEDLLLYALLGLNADSGTTPNFVHTSSLDDANPFSSPYLTIWDIWPGVTTTRYDGCRLSRAAFSSQPGQMVDVEYTVAALKATLHDTEPDLTGLFADELGHSWPELAVSLGGSHTGIVNNMSITINRNTGYFSGDNGLQALDVPNGLFAVDGSLEVAFQDDSLFRAANTGTTTGTALSTAVFSEALSIALARGANIGVALSLAAAQIKNFKTAMKTDGSPAVSTFDFSTKRQAALADALTAVVKNAIATATRA